MTHTVDTFVDATGTALESHTPDSGGPWANLGGDVGALQISSTDHLSKVTSAHGAGIWAVDTGSNDHSAAITINSGSSWPNSLVYVAVRVQDANNCYYLGHNSATGFFIRKFVAGSFTNLVTFSSSISTGDVFELHAVGNILTAYRNGSPISGGSVTDTTGSGGGAQFPTGSKCGLIVVATSAGANMFTKFEADTIGGGGPPPSSNDNHNMLSMGVG